MYCLIQGTWPLKWMTHGIYILSSISSAQFLHHTVCSCFLCICESSSVLHNVLPFNRWTTSSKRLRTWTTWPSCTKGGPPGCEQGRHADHFGPARKEAYNSTRVHRLWGPQSHMVHHAGENTGGGVGVETLPRVTRHGETPHPPQALQ